MVSTQKQLKQLHDALDHLAESISLRKQNNAPSQLRESVIKSLISCFDLMLKNLKNQLMENYEITVIEPRLVLKESFTRALLTKEEFEALEGLLTDYHSVSHRYSDIEIMYQVFKDETVAESIASRADYYHDVMNNVFNRMVKN